MRTAKVLAPETPETEPQRRSPRKHIKQETPTKSKKAKVEEAEKAVKKVRTWKKFKIKNEDLLAIGIFPYIYIFIIWRGY